MIIHSWEHREELSSSLNELYRSINISKQAVHGILNRRMTLNEELAYLKFILKEVRDSHPTMSIRAMYYKVNPIMMGRDKFELICKSLGFSVVIKKRNFPITTDSRGVKRFPNLVVLPKKKGKKRSKGIEATHPNQIWVSDITYFDVNGSFMYITFIMDQYTKLIVGYSVSSRLLTVDTTKPALKMAIRKTKNKEELKGLILHSDGGGQYFADDFIKVTKKYGIRNSMCEYAHENPYAERLNRTIKYCYLNHWTIDSLDQLIKKVDRAVTLYNYERPHKSLNYWIPSNFNKEYLNSLTQQVEGEGIFDA